MGHFQVLFSGDVVEGAQEAQVRVNLAHKFGLDERKVAQLFSGRTVVVRSQLDQAEALSWQEKLVAAHSGLSEETFVVEQNRPLPVVSSRRLNDFAVPDLRASRLYLVEARTVHDEATEQLVMHYRGMRGCALTIAAIAPIAEDGEVVAAASDDATLFAGWRFGKLGFAVIADGMDEARFQAIATYVKVAIDDRLTPKSDLRTAMAESYRAAKPCA